LSAITKVHRFVSDVVSDINPETGEFLHATLEDRLAILSKGLSVATAPDEQAAYINGIKILTTLRDNRDARLTKRR
jgi:hypothetical protein